MKMNKKGLILCLVSLFVCAGTASAQDLIIFTDGNEIQAKILEISDTDVSYKSWTNQDGPLRKVATSKIFMIKYEDGSKETFSTASEKSQYAEPLQPKPFQRLEQKQKYKDHRFVIGARLRPQVSLLVVDDTYYMRTNYTGGTGARFGCAAGVVGNWYFSKKQSNPWYLHAALELSPEGGNIRKLGYNFKVGYVNYELGVGVRTNGGFHMVYAMGTNTYLSSRVKAEDYPTTLSFKYARVPAPRVKVNVMIGGTIAKTVDLDFVFSFSPYGSVDPSFWQSRNLSADYLLGVSATYLFPIKKK